MSEMCACEAWDGHMRKEDECVVVKAAISSSEIKMKLLDFVDLQFMQFDLWILGDALKVGWVITQIEAVLMNDKGDDDGKEIIHISCLHNNSTLKVL